MNDRLGAGQVRRDDEVAEAAVARAAAGTPPPVAAEPRLTTADSPPIPVAPAAEDAPPDPTRASPDVVTTEMDAIRADDPAGSFDRALIDEARRGSLDAFNELVTRHQDGLYALVYRLVPDPDQAGDAVQEAFFSAYRNLASFRGGSVRSWLSRIAVNAAMDLQRSRKRRPSQPYPELEDESWQPPAEPAQEPDSRAVAAERSRALARALQSIGADQRTAIVLYDVEGYDYAEIASMTGVSVGTVKSRIHRGRLALRIALEPIRELFRG